MAKKKSAARTPLPELQVQRHVQPLVLAHKLSNAIASVSKPGEQPAPLPDVVVRPSEPPKDVVPSQFSHLVDGRAEPMAIESVVRGFMMVLETDPMYGNRFALNTHESPYSDIHLEKCERHLLDDAIAAVTNKRLHACSRKPSITVRPRDYVLWLRDNSFIVRHEHKGWFRILVLHCEQEQGDEATSVGTGSGEGAQAANRKTNPRNTRSTRPLAGKINAKDWAGVRLGVEGKETVHVRGPSGQPQKVTIADIFGRQAVTARLFLLLVANKGTFNSHDDEMYDEKPVLFDRHVARLTKALRDALRLSGKPVTRRDGVLTASFRVIEVDAADTGKPDNWSVASLNE